LTREDAVTRRSGYVAVVVAALVLAAGGTVAYAAAVPATRTVSVVVHPATVTGSLPVGLVGLSLEASELTRGDFRERNLVTYLRTLGPSGVLRVGGNSSDATFWTSTGERAPSWSRGTITPASLVQLGSVAQASGWSVVLGVNLKHKDATRAADEARHANQVLGARLQAIEIGNEPNQYYTSTSAYYADFEKYAAAIRNAVPGVRLVGPDPGYGHEAFLAAFAANESGHPDIAEITNHHYPLSACDGRHNTIPKLLSTASVQNENAAAKATVDAGNRLHVPAAITETNSVTCGGTKGVSDVYASTLWALDYTLLLANAGIANADYHGSLSGCGTYSPLCATANGLAAQPVYYGMLASRLVGPGQFAALTNQDPANIRAYAVLAGTRLTVVLDNVADPAHNAAATVSLTLGHSYRQGQQVLLATSSASGLAAKTGITLGGHAVAADGTFPAPTTTPVSVAGQSASIVVKPGTAAIVQFS
jgi:hypothetical protein